MKRILFFIFLLCSFLNLQAKHVTGGEMIYDFVSATATTKTYRITLILYRDENCSGCALMPASLAIGIYSNSNNQLVTSRTVQLSRTESVPLLNVPTCITNAPNLIYTAGYYTTTVTLDNNAAGYTASHVTCCRITGIANINNIDPDRGAGASYATTIPGSNNLPSGENDSSPRFGTGVSIICDDNLFTYNFSATDPDGDQLVYSFCSGYDGGAATNATTDWLIPPPYGSLAYINGFTGSSPLGSQATINPQTGIISGIAPAAGKYVVSVCVTSFRNGDIIAVHRKDFIVTVAPCDFANAELDPEYITCDGFSFTFSNNSNSALNLTSFWDFGDPASGVFNTSTAQDTVHVFSDTGIYTIKLVVNRGTPCADSATTRIKVYPGYFPAQTNSSPICKNIPVQFTDETTATYGVPSSWQWNFGVAGIINDTSRLENPTFTYTQTGTYTATLIVGSSKGCIDTVTSLVEIVDKPAIAVTNDTLICSVDNLQLSIAAPAVGSVTWTPNYNINNVNSYTPIVSPDVSTTYFVTYSDGFGCSNTDSVRVRVVDTVSLKTGIDTTICRTDGFPLPLISNALLYTWTPAVTLNNASLQNPIATPTSAFTTYYVRGNIGTCFDTDSIKVRTVPYPVPNAGADSIICFGTSAFLHASGGSSYSWSPAVFLSNATIANPTVVTPTAGILDYVVTVRDTLGCPKPVKDTVSINVDQVIANAGPRDTAVVEGQVLQLLATGSTNYLWTPETRWLSNPNIRNPISNPQDDIEYIVRVTNSIGCTDTDTILVKFYTVLPGFWVPSAFSPNGDGLNDVLKPLALGLKSIENFSVFNRWGQLVFKTAVIGQGWDGKLKGKVQETGTYVWYAEGTDYKNFKLQKKGNVVLIQ